MQPLQKSACEAPVGHLGSGKLVRLCHIDSYILPAVSPLNFFVYILRASAASWALGDLCQSGPGGSCVWGTGA